MVNEGNKILKTYWNNKVNERRILFLFFSGIILLPWAVPLNLLFRGTPLILWKQVFASVLNFTMICWFFQKKHPANSFGFRFLFFIYIWVCFSVFTWLSISLIEGLSVTRCAYAIIAYIGFFPYAVLPIIAYKYGRLMIMYKIVVIVAITCSVGIIADYLFNISSFIFTYWGSSFEAARNDISGGIFIRPKFPFGSSSACYGFLSLGFLFNYFIYNHVRTAGGRFMSLAGFVIILLGGFLTYTRTIWILLSVLLIVVTVFEILKKFRVKNIVLPVFVMMLIVFAANFYIPDVNIKGMDVLMNRIDNFMDFDEVSNAHRLYRWTQGLDLMTNVGSYTLFGHGLGSTMGQIKDVFSTHTHYESSFFQAYYEGGVFGIFVRYFGYLIAFVGFIKGGSGDSRINKLLIIWFGCYFLATFVSPTAGSYHGQMAFFMSVGMTMIRPYFRLRLRRKML